MIDVDKKVRTAIVAALDGTVSYNGSPVPCYDEENPNEEESIYIILDTQTGEDASLKTQFETIGTIQISVVHQTDARAYTYDAVDEVTDGIYQIMQPTPQTHGLTDPAGLQIEWVRRLSYYRGTVKDDSGNTMQRSNRYEYKVNEL